MASFRRSDYQAVYHFAREQYFWHESTGRGFDTKAAIIMSMCETVIGQQPDFPVEARQRLSEFPAKFIRKLTEEMSNGHSSPQA